MRIYIQANHISCKVVLGQSHIFIRLSKALDEGATGLWEKTHIRKMKHSLENCCMVGAGIQLHHEIEAKRRDGVARIATTASTLPKIAHPKLVRLAHSRSLNSRRGEC